MFESVKFRDLNLDYASPSLRRGLLLAGLILLGLIPVVALLGGSAKWMVGLGAWGNAGLILSGLLSIRLLLWRQNHNHHIHLGFDRNSTEMWKRTSGDLARVQSRVLDAIDRTAVCGSSWTAKDESGLRPVFETSDSLEAVAAILARFNSSNQSKSLLLTDRPNLSEKQVRNVESRFPVRVCNLNDTTVIFLPHIAEYGCIGVDVAEEARPFLPFSWVDSSAEILLLRANMDARLLLDLNYGLPVGFAQVGKREWPMRFKVWKELG